MSEFWDREKAILDRILDGGPMPTVCEGSSDPDAADFVKFVMDGGEYSERFAKWMPKENPGWRQVVSKEYLEMIGEA